MSASALAPSTGQLTSTGAMTGCYLCRQQRNGDRAANHQATSLPAHEFEYAPPGGGLRLRANGLTPAAIVPLAQMAAVMPRGRARASQSAHERWRDANGPPAGDGVSPWGAQTAPTDAWPGQSCRALRLAAHASLAGSPRWLVEFGSAARRSSSADLAPAFRQFLVRSC